jgi:hypothetical protein
VTIVGANFPKVLVALWLSNPAFAVASNELIVSGNDAVYAAAGSPVADIETAFSTTDLLRGHGTGVPGRAPLTAERTSRG